MTIRRLIAFALLVVANVALVPASPALAQQAILDKALFDASWRGNVAEVTRLLGQGANPNVVNQGSTPLHKAADGGHLEIMRQLMDHKADVNAKNSDGWSTLANAAGTHKPDATKLLLDAGAKPDGFALGQAGWLGRVETVQLLLDAGADPNDGLVRAAQGRHVQLVKLLLENGADVQTTAQSQQGDTALHTGALQGGFEMVQLLLKHGADPNAVNKQGQTPLHRAIAGDGELKTVKLLVESGAKLDIPDKEGVTPVRMAGTRARGRPALYDWLLTAAGGKEPPPNRPVRATPADPRSAKELLATLSAKDYKVRVAAERELAARGNQIMPAVLESGESGADILRFSKLLVALGPEAEAAIPKLEPLLNDKKHVFAAAFTLDRMQPGFLDKLPAAARQRTAAALYEAIVDPDMAEMASWHLGLLVSLGEVCVPHVLELLRSTNAELKRRAADSLETARFASDDITAELIKLSQDSSQPAARSEAARALGKFGESTPEVRAALLAILQNPPPPRGTEADPSKVRKPENWRETAESAARSLARFGPSVIDDLLPLLTPIGAHYRIPAISALASQGVPAVPRLIELLAHEDEAVAIASQIALGRIRTGAVPELTKAVSGSNEPIARRAADVLAENGSAAKAALPALLVVAEDDNRADTSRMAAVGAAMRIDPQTRESKAVLSTIPVLIRVLDKGTFKEQGAAARTLGAIGRAARDALPILHQRLELPGENIDTGGLVRNYVQQSARAAIAAIEGKPADQAVP